MRILLARVAVGLAAALILVGFASSANKDRSSQAEQLDARGKAGAERLYARGKAAYDSSDFVSALKYLYAYRILAELYGSKTRRLSKIDSVIEYAEAKAKGYQTSWKQQRQLSRDLEKSVRNLWHYSSPSSLGAKGILWIPTVLDTSFSTAEAFGDRRGPGLPGFDSIGVRLHR